MQHTMKQRLANKGRQQGARPAAPKAQRARTVVVRAEKASFQQHRRSA